MSGFNRGDPVTEVKARAKIDDEINQGDLKFETLEQLNETQANYLLRKNMGHKLPKISKRNLDISRSVDVNHIDQNTLSTIKQDNSTGQLESI
mgnify:CR=1 FL=1|jgi:hypothetical protein